jgi:hypothetical protein
MPEDRQDERSIGDAMSHQLSKLKEESDARLHDKQYGSKVGAKNEPSSPRPLKGVRKMFSDLCASLHSAPTELIVADDLSSVESSAEFSFDCSEGESSFNSFGRDDEQVKPASENEDIEKGESLESDEEKDDAEERMVGSASIDYDFPRGERTDKGDNRSRCSDIEAVPLRSCLQLSFLDGRCGVVTLENATRNTSETRKIPPPASQFKNEVKVSGDMKEQDFGDRHEVRRSRRHELILRLPVASNHRENPRKLGRSLSAERPKMAQMVTRRGSPDILPLGRKSTSSFVGSNVGKNTRRFCGLPSSACSNTSNTKERAMRERERLSQTYHGPPRLRSSSHDDFKVRVASTSGSCGSPNNDLLTNKTTSRSGLLLSQSMHHNKREDSITTFVKDYGKLSHDTPDQDLDDKNLKRQRQSLTSRQLENPRKFGQSLSVKETR